MTGSVGCGVHDIDELLAQEPFRTALADAERQATPITDQLYGECARRGLFALGTPADYGGLELPLTARVRLHEAIAPISPSLQSVLTVHEMAAYAIARFGPRELAERWLPVMSTGECAGAFALTEPAGGSDFAQVLSRATVCSDGIRLDGTKSWISSGLRAGVFVVFADSSEGPLALCVPGDTPGLNRTPGARLNSFGAASIATLRLSGCIVDPRCRLGSAGMGLIRVATGCLTMGRVLVAAAAVGVAASALAALITHANSRVVGRRPLAASQLVCAAVADAHVRVRAARMLTAHAAQAFDERAPEAAQHAIEAKLAATEAAQKATMDSLRLHGAAGLAADSAVLRYASAAQVYANIEGSAEALTSALGSALLRSGSYESMGSPP